MIQVVSQTTVKIYIAILFVSTLVFAPFLLDFTLLPRFLSLSAGLILIVTYIFLSAPFTKVSLSVSQVLISLFYIFSLFSISWAINKAEAFFEAQKIFLFLCVFFLTHYLIQVEKCKDYFFKTCVILAITIHCIALYQFITAEDRSSFYVITSISGHKNLMVSFIFLLLPFQCAGLLTFKERWRNVTVITVLISIFLILVLQTRAAWIGGLVSIVMLLYFFMNPNWKVSGVKLANTFLLFIFLFSVVFSYFYFIKLQGFNSTVHPDVRFESTLERWLLWKKTLLMINDHMVFGVGAGNWQVELPNYSLSGLVSAEKHHVTFQRPHNDYLWILSETGLIGFIFYLGYIAAVVYNGFRFAFKGNKQMKIFVSFVVGYLVIAFFDFPKERIEHIIFFSVLLAIINSSSETSSIISFRFHRIFVVIPLALLVFNIVMGWNRMTGESNMRKVYIYKARQHWEKVISYSEKALNTFYTLDPTSVPVAWYTGLAEYGLNNKAKAFEDFSTANRYAPYNQYVLNNLGACLENMNKNKEAKKYFLRALEISPNFDDPKLNLAAIYYNEENFQQAYHWVTDVRQESEKKKKYLEYIQLKLQINK